MIQQILLVYLMDFTVGNLFKTFSGLILLTSLHKFHFSFQNYQLIVIRPRRNRCYLFPVKKEPFSLFSPPSSLWESDFNVLLSPYHPCSPTPHCTTLAIRPGSAECPFHLLVPPARTPAQPLRGGQSLLPLQPALCS